MTRRIGNVVIIEPERSQQCDFCNKIRELRPYGPKGEAICFDCAMKDRATTERRMGEVLFSDVPSPTPDPSKPS